MAHAIIRGANGRRHEVDFKDMEITVELFLGNETVKIAIEAPEDPVPSAERRFALLNVPRELFNKALGEAARRSKTERPAQCARDCLSPSDWERRGKIGKRTRI